jgi:hypothetical protein
MKNFYFIKLFIILASFSNNANSQSFAWAKQMEGSGSGGATSIAVDADGNVYTAGGFTGTADFDPGPGIYNLTPSSANGAIFVSKLDNAGNFIWAKQFTGATFTENAYAIAVDANGNVYTTGMFSGTIDFNPGAGTYNLMAPGSYDVFVSKLDSSGNFVWAKQFIAGSGNTDYGYSIALDDSGNVYTAGQFMSTCDFDPGAGVYNLTSAGNNDIFISKLNASGNFVWAKKMGGTASDGGLAITLDGSGNIYTSGWFMGTVDFDPGAGTYNLSTSSSSDGDIFVSRLDNSGNFAWAKRMGGTGIESGNAIAVDAGGNVYTTGDFSGTSDFDPDTGIYNLSSIANQYDIFVSKLDSSGNFAWAKQMGGALADFGYGIAVDASGNAYTTGYFNSATADFDPGTGTYDLTCFGVKDIFISKLDSSGNFIWAGQLGGADYDDGFGITVDGVGNVYSCGNFRSTGDFDPSAGTYYLTCPGFGANTFIVKLSDFTTGTTEDSQALSSLSGIEIFPNPANETLNVKCNILITELSLYNSLGELVCRKPLAAGSSEIDLSAEEKGIYFLLVTAGNCTETKRIVIIK